VILGDGVMGPFCGFFLSSAGFIMVHIKKFRIVEFLFDAGKKCVELKKHNILCSDLTKLSSV